MTLFLSSNSTFILLEGLKILSKPLDKLNLVWVTTASKGVDDKTYLEKHKQLMGRLRIQYEELDIEGKSPDDLREILQNKDAVFVDGGNTFYLLKAIKESGFEAVLKDLLQKGLVYFGSSAGAYIACPTIETSRWKVSEKDIKEDYGMTDLTAMSLVPFLLKVHYTPEQKDFLKTKITETSRKVKILADNQAFLVKDEQVIFMGTGQEIKL